jgi:hypothetical protein
LSIDLRLASELAAGLDPSDTRTPPLRREITLAIQRALTDSEEVVRHRGLAAVGVRGSEFSFEKVVQALVSLESAEIVLPLTLTERQLWECRTELPSALRIPFVKRHVLKAISESGEPRWASWLEGAVASGLLDPGEACGAALACTAVLPQWIAQALPSALRQAGWYLRAAGLRGVNRPLAQWIAEHYEEFTVERNSTWWDMNAVLVKCGDDEIYEQLLSRFLRLDEHSQEVLGYAIEQLGPSWLARFQTKAFGDGLGRRNHRLLARVSPMIPEATARSWLAASEPSLRELGWRTLATIRQNEVIPEIVAALPSSFDGVEECQALVAIPCLSDAPSELLDELWKRMNGRLGARTAEQLIFAIAAVRPLGVPSIVGRLNGDMTLPTAHLVRFLEKLGEWEGQHRIALVAATPAGKMSYGEAVVFNAFRATPLDPFVGQMFRAYRPAVLATSVLDRAAAGEPLASAFVSRMGRVGRYHAGLAGC